MCSSDLGAPFYFSIDLDVLEPAEFAAVSDPIPGGLAVDTVAALARAALALAPVGADLVEYNPLRDPEGQCLRRIAPLLFIAARRQLADTRDHRRPMQDQRLPRRAAHARRCT